VTFSKFKFFVLAGFVFVCIPVCLTTAKSSPSNGVLGADDGATLFVQKCAVCHGKDGKGMASWKAKGQPDFTDAHFQSSVSDQQISDSIHNGKGKYMPAFKGKLSDDQISALVAQVRAFGKK